jgi:3-hydroxy-9,10-secoandrosta-1,3,5(10)-triene-9,17-dione monooxygenase
LVNREELVHRAAELVPALRERAGMTETLRQIPQETLDDYHASGILRAAQPTRFGGFDIDYPVVLDIAAELGRGCGSSAWCYGIWAAHNWVAGMFPEKAQKEYWLESSDVLSSTSVDPSRAHVTSVKGGYQLSGRWSFSSGCDAAAWAILGAVGPDGLIWLMLPRSDYAIIDNWFVSGLRGTGSKDIEVNEVFVPEYRVVSLADLRQGQSPGRTLHGTPNFRIPLLNMFAYSLAAPVLGMAQGALEAFEEHMGGRVDYTTSEKMVENAPVHIRLSEAQAEVHSARLIMADDGQEVVARAKKEETATLRDRARIRRNQAYVAKLSVSAVDRLFDASGGHALFDDNPMQRFHRDVHAASHHFGLAWDIPAEEYGRMRLGLEPKNPARL